MLANFIKKKESKKAIYFNNDMKSNEENVLNDRSGHLV